MPAVETASCGDNRGRPLASKFSRPHRSVIHPVHAVLLASVMPLFFGALVSDWAYWNSAQIQWINFASWLIVGALIFASLALLWAFIDALRADAPRGRGRWLYVILLGATVALGIVNALVHAKDGWATMPAGIILSVIVFILALAAIWTGFSTPGRESRNEI